MLKKIIILLFVVAPFATFAQDKMAHVNTQELFALMPEIKDVESKMATKQEEIKKNLTAMEAEYNKKMEEFKNSKEEPTESILLDRQKQIQQIQERYETYSQNSEKEFQELRQTLLSPLQQKLQKAIKDVGTEQGYTYIIEAGALPFIGASAVNADKFVKAKLGVK